MSEKLHISSLLVTVIPDLVERVAGTIGKMDIAEIAHMDTFGKIIVILETADESVIVDALTEIQLLKGVVSAALVFHHSEPVELALSARPNTPEPSWPSIHRSQTERAQNV